MFERLCLVYPELGYIAKPEGNYDVSVQYDNPLCSLIYICLIGHVLVEMFWGF